MKETKKRWASFESSFLVDSFKLFTIKELMAQFPDRTQDAINCKAKRLRKLGWTLRKTKSAKARAYRQRRR